MSASTKWTNEFLDEMRKQGDPMADEAASALFDAIRGHSAHSVREFIVSFVSQDFAKKWQGSAAIPDPPALVRYFSQSDEFVLTPKEIETLDKGSDFFIKNGPSAVFALGVRSLLKQYAHTKAIEVLRLTTLLVDHVNRRILETMQFVLDVMEPGYAEVKSDQKVIMNLMHPGLMSIKKLRLVHAMVRYRILNGMYNVEELGLYDEKYFGHPINQEDMVFAVHTFSVEIIQALREIHVTVSDEEAETYFECWKIIGRMLGVSPELEPTSYADAEDLQNLIYKRHFTMPNATGPVLSRSLIQWFTTSIPLLDEKMLMNFIKEFNGPENEPILINNLKIDIHASYEDLHKHLTDDLRFHEKEGRPATLLKDKSDVAMDNFFLYFLQTLISTEGGRRGGKMNAQFRIGDGFSSSWNINQISDKPMPKWQVAWLAIKTFFNELMKKISAFFGNANKP